MTLTEQNDGNAIVRCVACDGYGWVEAENTSYLDEDAMGESECAWCGGVGYVFRSTSGVDTRIPPEQLPSLSERLEHLEIERLREMGYSGAAKKPWEQAIRIDRGDSIAQRKENRTE